MPEIDPTFYRSPAAAVAAAPEQLAYVVAFDPTGQAKDALAVVDCEPNSSTYGGVVGWSVAADGRQRTAPLRLERVLERAVSRGAWPVMRRLSGDICSSPASVRRRRMSLTPSPTLAIRW